MSTSHQSVSERSERRRREVCEAAEAAYRAGLVPLNAAEGFIR